MLGTEVHQASFVFIAILVEHLCVRRAAKRSPISMKYIQWNHPADGELPILVSMVVMISKKVRGRFGRTNTTLNNMAPIL